ncbi:MAG: tetratricopeptide repeat protein [Ghiorsea sp.]
MKLLLSLLFISGLTAVGLYFTSSEGINKSSDSDMMQLGDFAYQEKRFSDAFNWYQNAADQGLSRGQLSLSQLYQNGEGVEKDEILATHWLKKAADQGLPQAQYEYAVALEFGRGVKRGEMRDVAPWYKKAAQRGQADATIKLTKIYLNGVGLPKDLSQALSWSLRAKQANIKNAETLLQQVVKKVVHDANAGDSEAQYMLAIMYKEGRGLEKNTDKQIFWLRKAAKKGYLEAQFALGQGLAKTESWSDALYWLKKSAQQGHAQAGYSIAPLLTKTKARQSANKGAWRWLYHGLQMNHPKAIYNLSTALNSASLGLPKSKYNYGSWLEQSAIGGLTEAQNDYAVYLQTQHKDAKQSVAWFHKAAVKDVKAQFNLGLVYARGDGITPNDDEAIRWWKKAEANGNAQARTMLGLFYNLGRGVGRSEKDAVDWYLKAAEAGDQNAIYNLAILYLNGRGIDLDYAKSAKYFEQLAKQGDTEAQNTLASLFLEGKGIKYSPKTAVHWFSLAAKAGEKKAMFNLATQYRTGGGAKQNDKKALFWYKKAADLNFAPAQNAVGYMYAEGRGTKVDKDKAEVWFQKASDNGLRLATKNTDALKQRGAFSLIRIQTDTKIRSDVLTDKSLDLSLWLQAHRQLVL